MTNKNKTVRHPVPWIPSELFGQYDKVESFAKVLICALSFIYYFCFLKKMNY